MNRMFGLVLVFAALACAESAVDLDLVGQDSGLSHDASGIDATTSTDGGLRGQIDVLPRVLNFGVTTTLGPIRSMLVTNIGWSTLSIQSVQLDDRARRLGFSVRPDISGVRIEPGETIELKVQLVFTDVLEGAAELIIESDDADTPVVRVPLILF